MSRSTDYLGLQGRTLLVTGASSGIGRETALAASEQGARIALLGRRPEALEETRELLAGDGHLLVPFDLVEPRELPGALAEVVQQLGPIDGIFHAAGVHEVSPIRALTETQIDRLFATNVTSAALLVKAFRNPRVRGERPSIVLMSSAVGLVGEAGVSIYAATKAAIASLGRSFALELAAEGIRVNTIAAGMVETPLSEGLRARLGTDAWAAIQDAHPLGIGTARDVANAALYLLSPASNWVTGTALVVDGGYTAK